VLVHTIRSTERALHSQHDAQLSQTDRAAGCIVLDKIGIRELGDNIYGHYRSIINHCDIIGLKSY